MRSCLRLLGGCAIFVMACNAIVDFDELEPLEDAGATDGGPDARSGSNDGGSEPDGRDVVESPRCNPLAPFGTPELDEGLNDGDGGTSSDAVLTVDELEVFFVHKNASDVRTLRHGRRTDRTQPWTAAQIVTETLSPTPTSNLSIAANGLRLYYRDAESSTNRVATRGGASAAFGSAVTYNTPGAIFIAPSDETAYGSFRPDGGDTVLGSAANLGTSSELFDAIPNVHVEGATDVRPVVNASETKLYFTSTRQGQLARAGDVYVATRVSKAAEFGPSTHVEELSSPGVDDIVTWVSDDDCEVLLTRFTGIYRASRPK